MKNPYFGSSLEEFLEGEGIPTKEAPIEVVRRVARAIAACKRGVTLTDPAIDKVWTSYVGMARVAIAAYEEAQAATRA